MSLAESWQYDPSTLERLVMSAMLAIRQSALRCSCIQFTRNSLHPDVNKPPVAFERIMAWQAAEVARKITQPYHAFHDYNKKLQEEKPSEDAL